MSFKLTGVLTARPTRGDRDGRTAVTPLTVRRSSPVVADV